jgi:hypothetical protein
VLRELGTVAGGKRGETQKTERSGLSFCLFFGCSMLNETREKVCDKTDLFTLYALKLHSLMKIDLTVFIEERKNCCI